MNCFTAIVKKRINQILTQSQTFLSSTALLVLLPLQEFHQKWAAPMTNHWLVETNHQTQTTSFHPSERLRYIQPSVRPSLDPPQTNQVRHVENNNSIQRRRRNSEKGKAASLLLLLTQINTPKKSPTNPIGKATAITRSSSFFSFETLIFPIRSFFLKI